MRRRGATRTRRGGRRSRTRSRSVTGLARRVTRLERGTETKVKVWSEDVTAIPGANDSTSLSSTYIYRGFPRQLLLNSLERGSAVQHRIGDKVRWTYFKGKVGMTIEKDVMDKFTMHYAFIRIKQPSGLSTSASDILDRIYGKDDPDAWDIPNDLNHGGKWRNEFEFLYSCSLTHHPGIDNRETNYDGVNIYHRNIKFPINKTTDYVRSNYGDYRDMETNAIWLIVWSTDEQASGSANHYGARAHFAGTFYFKDS